MELSPPSSHSHFRRDKNEKKRQRTQRGPNQMWFDAIMSKSRPIEDTGVCSEQSLVPEYNGRHHVCDDREASTDYMQVQRVSSSHNDGYVGHVRAASLVSSANDLKKSSQQQLTIDPVVLHLAMAKALQQVVNEQRCCLIASGLCHLCDSQEHRMVPVVNFCPISKPNHSLCRDHLQSLHRIRIEDVFIDKTFLKCSICSLSCPCTTCQLERETHFQEYTQWLRQDESLINTTTPHRPEMAPVPVPSTLTPTPPPVDNEMEENESLSMSAEPKQVGRPRLLKRATKETRPSEPINRPQRDTPPTIEVPSALSTGKALETLPVESPSAVSVLNCPASEQSLVRLLSSLNQEVTPAIQYITNEKERVADSKQPVDRERKGGEEKERDNDLTSNPRESQKRKRDVVKGNDSGSIKKSTVESSIPPRSVNKPKTMTIEDTVPPSFRKKAPPPLAVDKKNKLESPSPSPRISGRHAARGKTTVADTNTGTTKKRPGRKRKNENRKSPRTSTPPRILGKRGRKPANVSIQDKKATEPDSDEEMKDQMVAEGALDEEEEEEESDLDTNLDYCEVCLAAGDLVCCDICPRSFHLSCLKMTEADLPLGDWQCVECKKPSYFEIFAIHVQEKTTVKAKCLQIIECLQSHPFAKPFLTPVEDVPLYLNVVKEPMDLSTIERKLKQREYAPETSDKGISTSSSFVGSVPTTVMTNAQGINLIAFAEDVRLVWSNCKLFNDDGSGITRAADELAIGFETLYRDVVECVARMVAKKNGGASAQTKGTDTNTVVKGSVSPSPVTSTAVSSNPSPTDRLVEATSVEAQSST